MADGKQGRRRIRYWYTRYVVYVDMIRVHVRVCMDMICTRSVIPLRLWCTTYLLCFCLPALMGFDACRLCPCSLLASRLLCQTAGILQKQCFGGLIEVVWRGSPFWSEVLYFSRCKYIDRIARNTLLLMLLLAVLLSMLMDGMLVLAGCVTAVLQTVRLFLKVCGEPE